MGIKDQFQLRTSSKPSNPSDFYASELIISFSVQCWHVFLLLLLFFALHCKTVRVKLIDAAGNVQQDGVTAGRRKNRAGVWLHLTEKR